MTNLLSLTNVIVSALLVLVPCVTAILAWRATQAHRPESGRLASKGGQPRPSLFNGYAPLIRDAVERMERYQNENEALRLELADLRAELRTLRGRDDGPASPPPEKEPPTRRTRSATRSPSSSSSRAARKRQP